MRIRQIILAPLFIGVLLLHGCVKEEKQPATGKTDSRTAGKPKPSAKTQPSFTMVPVTKASGGDVAKEFWGALTKGDTDTMKRIYAPRVTIKAGSVLLWENMNISKTGNIKKDVVAADRKKIIKAYKYLIAFEGKQTWVMLFSDEVDPAKFFIATAEKDGVTFPEVRRGDVIFKPTKDSTDMIWVLRRDKEGNWRVVIEKFDF